MQQPQPPPLVPRPTGLAGITPTQAALLGGAAAAGYALFGRAGLLLGPLAVVAYIGYQLRGVEL